MNMQTHEFEKIQDGSAEKIVQTAGFVHAVGDTAVLSFPTKGNAPRMFMAFISQGHIRNGRLDRSMNGVTIVDIDTAKIVATKINTRPKAFERITPDQRFTLAALETLEWENFSSYCRNAESYIGNIPDICAAAPEPYPGNPMHQQMVRKTILPQIDIRSDFLTALDADPEVPYSFPQISRDIAIADIMNYDRFDRDGKSFYLSLDIRMKNDWNTSGWLPGGHELCREFDEAWSEHYQKHPEIFEQACETVLAPFVVNEFRALDMGGEAACHLDVAGAKGGYLVLKEFGGQQMSFSSGCELKSFLQQLPDEDLCNLWATLNVISVDLSLEERTAMLEAEINDVRAGIEEDWSIMNDQEAVCA